MPEAPQSSSDVSQQEIDRKQNYDRLNLQRNNAETAIGFGINLILAILTYRLLILFGGLELLGVWAALQSWFMLVRIGDAGLGGASTYFIGKMGTDAPKLQYREVIDTAIVVNTGIYAIFSVVCFIFALYFINVSFPEDPVSNVQAQTYQALPLVAMASFSLGLSQPILGSLNGLNIAFVSARLSVVGTLIQLALTVLLVPSMGLPGLAIAQISQHLTITCLAWVVVLKMTNAADTSWVPRHLRPDFIGRLLRYSVKFQVTSAAQNLFDPVAKLLVGQFGGLAALGIYEMAFKTVNTPRALVYTVVLTIHAGLSNLLVHDPVKARQLYLTIMRRTYIAALALSIMTCIATPVASLFWLNEINATYLAFVAIGIVGHLFNATAAPALVVGLASGRLWWNTGAHLMTLVVMLAVFYPLQLALGDYGIVISTSIALIVNALILRIMNGKFYIMISQRC